MFIHKTIRKLMHKNDQNTLTFIIPPSHIESLDGVNTGHIQCPGGGCVSLRGVETAAQIVLRPFPVHNAAGLAACGFAGYGADRRFLTKGYVHCAQRATCQILNGRARVLTHTHTHTHTHE